jgi:mannose-6-phosphate isomerase-like protein (cupin superfamily)
MAGRVSGYTITAVLEASSNNSGESPAKEEIMGKVTVAVIGAISLFGLCGIVAFSQQGGPAAAGPVVPDAPTDKTAFWSNNDIQARWKDIETRKVINSRLFNGPMDQSVNVRIVLEGDGPLVHPKTADLWIVQAGTATAVTDGQMVGTESGQQTGDVRGKSINTATERPVHAGDILYIPPGVPHYFKDIKGFRAFLVRFDPK